MAFTRSPLAHHLRAVSRTPAQLAAFLLAVWFTSNGPIGLLIGPSFATDPAQGNSIDLLGFIPVTVNGWHALFHLATGLPGLWLARSRAGTAWYALVVGLVYLGVAAFGFADGTTIAGLLSVDTFGNRVHAIEGTLLLVVAAAAVRVSPSKDTAPAEATPRR